jgi:hypothetical protein
MTVKSSPSETLSAELLDRLIAAGLLRAKRRDALIAKIAAGEMRGQDWKHEIDLAQTKVAPK